MFEYKEASFYTSYFKNHPDFELVEEFKELEDQGEKNNYVGIIEVLDTIHPLLLRVEIPKSFSHQKLTFRTKSISGYPHLIHQSPSIDPNVDKGDWFCLNTLQEGFKGIERTIVVLGALQGVLRNPLLSKGEEIQ